MSDWNDAIEAALKALDDVEPVETGRGYMRSDDARGTIRACVEAVRALAKPEPATAAPLDLGVKVALTEPPWAVVSHNCRTCGGWGGETAEKCADCGGTGKAGVCPRVVAAESGPKECATECASEAEGGMRCHGVCLVRSRATRKAGG